MGPEPIENIKASFNADARCEESLTLTHVGEKFLLRTTLAFLFYLIGNASFSVGILHEVFQESYHA